MSHFYDHAWLSSVLLAELMAASDSLRPIPQEMSFLLQAELMADFLRPMLEYEPERRATAQEMLSHPWLKAPVTGQIRRGSAASAQTAAPGDERTRRRPTHFDQEHGSPAGLAPKRSR